MTKATCMMFNSMSLNLQSRWILLSTNMKILIRKTHKKKLQINLALMHGAFCYILYSSIQVENSFSL